MVVGKTLVLRVAVVLICATLVFACSKPAKEQTAAAPKPTVAATKKAAAPAPPVAQTAPPAADTTPAKPAPTPVAAALEVRPASLGISPQPGTPAPISRKLTITPGTVKQFKVLEVKPPVTDMQSTVTQRSDGAAVVELTNIVPSADLIGKTVIIKTDAPSMPEITVPFKLVHAIPATPPSSPRLLSRPRPDSAETAPSPPPSPAGS